MGTIIKITSVLIVTGEERRRVQTDVCVCRESVEELRNFAMCICGAERIFFSFEDYEGEEDFRV